MKSASWVMLLGVLAGGCAYTNEEQVQAYRDDAVRQDANFGQSIGAPAVFIFTAKGDVVFAGPKSTNGMPPGDEFKKLLIAGIEKNGGLRGQAKTPAASLAADVAKAYSFSFNPQFETDRNKLWYEKVAGTPPPA